MVYYTKNIISETCKFFPSSRVVLEIRILVNRLI